MNNKFLLGIIINILLLLLILSLAIYIKKDTRGPVISFEGESLTYNEKDSTDMLLAGVKAIDDVDGDVSDTLVIEAINILRSEKKANVIYAARDKSNNITKVSRIIDYHIINQDENQFIDDKDKTIEDDRQEDTNENNNQEDEKQNNDDNSNDHDINDNNTDNQDQDTGEPLVSTGDPIIRLNTYAVTIRAGESFNPMRYVAEAVDDIDDAWRRVHVDGNYHTTIAGQYTLKYSIRDSDGNISNIEELTLTVE